MGIGSHSARTGSAEREGNATARDLISTVSQGLNLCYLSSSLPFQPPILQNIKKWQQKYLLVSGEFLDRKDAQETREKAVPSAMCVDPGMWVPGDASASRVALTLLHIYIIPQHHFGFSEPSCPT